MKKKKLSPEEAEAAYAKKIYRERPRIEREAQAMLARLPDKSSQISIRLANDDIALAKNQAAARGLRYQTYIKMLLYEALHRG